jgi:hypothetical protein
MKIRLSVLVGAGLLLAGCQTAPSGPPGLPPPPPPPPRNEFEWSAANGPNVIEGEAVWRHDGRVFSCAGQSVGLTPETPYTRQRMAELYGSDEAAIQPVTEVRARAAKAPTTRDYHAYVRSTECDSRGRFVFRDLPDGGWFVIAPAESKSGCAGPMSRAGRRGPSGSAADTKNSCA